MIGRVMKDLKGPIGWKESLKLIKEMRNKITAPVDTMGCHMLAADNSTPKDKRLQTLIALMLSSQTKDEITAAAMKRLHSLPLNLTTLLKTDKEKIEELIYPVGFYRRKAEYIKKVADLINERSDKDIPCTLNELVKLPGVGPKMAHLVLQNAWNKTEGIGVDVHVHRIVDRLGWVNTNGPEATRKALEDWLPREYWTEINPLLVGFGQKICLPIRPKCSECLLKETCPAANLNNGIPSKRRKHE